MPQGRLRTSVEAWAVGFFATVGLPLACNGQTEQGDASRTHNGDNAETKGLDAKQTPTGAGDAGSGKTAPTSSRPDGGEPATSNTPVSPPSTPGVPVPVSSATPPDPSSPNLVGPTTPELLPAPTDEPPAPEVPVEPLPTDDGFFACVGPKPVLDFEGNPSNLLECERGLLWRQDQPQCPSNVPEHPTSDAIDAGAASGPFVDAGVYSECSKDSDCTERSYGRCLPDYSYGAYCDYGCVVDSDCDEGYACLCDYQVGTCVRATCKTDADCTDGALCTATFGWDCGHNVIVDGFQCQGVDDECGGPGDCTGENAACVEPGYTSGDGRTCQTPEFECGRPFVVRGNARVAPSRTTSWSREKLAPLLPEEARVRARLAEHWTAIGLMEHASIAAFARFSLQLLALGAPADLVEQSNQALADELQHTELAFALASAYGGGAVGPGPLAIDGSLEEQSLEAIVRLVVVEGCIGETVAALEAREAAAHAMDPVVRAALERIADDEAGHAALAWRTLRWATECSRADGSSAGDEAIVGTIEAAFEQGLRALSESNPDHDDLTRHGVLSSSLRSELCEQACTVLRAGFASLRAHSEARGRAA